MNNEFVIDATNSSLGRVASIAAKKALLGNKVHIIHCEHAIVIGSPRSVIEDYRAKRKIGGASMHGPFFPKHSDRVMKRTVRGMLPFKNPRGKEAIKRVKCHIGIPAELKDHKAVHMPVTKKLASIRLEELSKEI